MVRLRVIKILLCMRLFVLLFIQLLQLLHIALYGKRKVTDGICQLAPFDGRNIEMLLLVL